MTSSNLQKLVSAEVEKQSGGTISTQEAEQIYKTIQRVVGEKSDTSVETLQYNVSFWVQALLRNKKTLLRKDEPFIVYYPQEPSIIPFTGIFAVDYLLQFIPVEIKLRYFISNFGEITALFQQHKEEILRCLESKNLVVLSNHASWLNLPLIAICLHSYCGVPKEKIYTLLGPAITTRSLAFSGIANFSHLFKTVPDTQNGKIIPEEMVAKIREQMYRTLIKSFRKPEGNVLLIAPSGTTDVYDPKDGRFALAGVRSATFNLLHRVGKEASAIVIGINDKQIMPTNSGLKRGEVYVGMGKVVPGEDIQQTVLALPELVISSDGTSIGKWK